MNNHIEEAVFGEAATAGVLVAACLDEPARIRATILLLDRLSELQDRSALPCELAVYTGLLTALGFSDLGDVRGLHRGYGTPVDSA